jgi:hypothetical protein
MARDRETVLPDRPDLGSLDMGLLLMVARTSPSGSSQPLPSSPTIYETNVFELDHHKK